VLVCFVILCCCDNVIVISCICYGFVDLCVLFGLIVVLLFVCLSFLYLCFLFFFFFCVGVGGVETSSPYETLTPKSHDYCTQFPIFLEVKLYLVTSSLLALVSTSSYGSTNTLAPVIFMFSCMCV